MPNEKVVDVATLVQKYVRLEDRLLQALVKLKTLKRSDVRREYLNSTLSTPELAVDSLWNALVIGDEPVEYFDEVLLDLAPESKNFSIADAILTWAAEKNWGEKVQNLMNDDVRAMLAERAERGEVLQQFVGAHEGAE